MATEKQVEANRQSAKKSIGPKMHRNGANAKLGAVYSCFIFFVDLGQSVLADGCVDVSEAT